MAINVRLDLELAYAGWLAQAERDRQGDIVAARKYYGGEHEVPLTDRQKEFLAHQLDKQRFAVNYCPTIVDAVVERMIVKGFGGDKDAFAQWAWDRWQENRMDAKQLTVHHRAVLDGEAFVFVDWDGELKRPVLIPHPRYTDPVTGGDGFGCKAFYPDEDESQPMIRASKRWTETIRDERGNRDTRRRMTVYYPGRVEKWVATTKTEGGWAQLIEDGEPWPIPWTEGDVPPGAYDENGQWQRNPDAVPLGIPIVHFYNPHLTTELWDAIPVQDLINKTTIDIIATADAAGYPVRVAKGFTPTSDGLPPAENKSNYLEITPGVWISNVPKDGGVDVLEAADISGLLESLDSWIIKLAQITDTPISRFQITRQVAAEGTLKQQEAPLLAKVRIRQTLFGNGWENCMTMAAKVARKYGGRGVPEPAGLDTLWESAETRDEKEFRESLLFEMQMGVPREVLWEKLGYDQDDIARMKAMRQEEMQQQSNIGGELLRQFEGGGFQGGE